MLLIPRVIENGENQDWKEFIWSQFLTQDFLNTSIQVQHAQKQLEPFFLRKKSIQIKIVLFAKKTSGSELLKSSELNQFQKAGEFPVKKDIFI